MAYGYFGDIIRESEDLRWIGPKRYDFAGIKRFMVNKWVHIVVTLFRWFNIHVMETFGFF